jgi:hypothetical protein
MLRLVNVEIAVLAEALKVLYANRKFHIAKLHFFRETTAFSLTKKLNRMKKAVP